jgi:hypothetical protein
MGNTNKSTYMRYEQPPTDQEIMILKKKYEILKAFEKEHGWAYTVNRTLNKYGILSKQGSEAGNSSMPKVLKEKAIIENLFERFGIPLSDETASE